MLLWSALGPYLVGPLRLDHFSVYFLLLIVIAKFAMGGVRKVKAEPFIFFSVLMCYFVWVLVSHLVQHGGSGVSVAALENSLQPVALSAVLIFIMGKATGEARLEYLTLACKTVIALMALNAAIALLNMYGYLSQVEHYFVRGMTLRGHSVWADSAIMGRYPGLFGQPFEAGLGYGLAILCFGYLTATKRLNTVNWILLALVCLGGVLSVSKVFIGVAVPIFFVYVIKYVNLLRSRILIAISVMLPPAIYMSVSIGSHWLGLDYFLRLFDLGNFSGGRLVETVTANRFSASDSGAMHGINYVMSHSPIGGFGFTQADFALDSSITEALWFGGVPALMFYVFSLMVLVAFSVRYLRLFPAEAGFLLAVTGLIVFSALGAPTWTLNRSSILVLVVIMLTLYTLGARGERRSQ